MTKSDSYVSLFKSRDLEVTIALLGLILPWSQFLSRTEVTFKKFNWYTSWSEDCEASKEKILDLSAVHESQNELYALKVGMGLKFCLQVSYLPFIKVYGKNIFIDFLGSSV